MANQTRESLHWIIHTNQPKFSSRFMTSWCLGPVSVMIIYRNSNLMEIFLIVIPLPTIRLKHIFWVKWNFHWIWIEVEKLLVKQDPGPQQPSCWLYCSTNNIISYTYQVTANNIYSSKVVRPESGRFLCHWQDFTQQYLYKHSPEKQFPYLVHIHDADCVAGFKSFSNGSFTISAAHKRSVI